MRTNSHAAERRRVLSAVIASLLSGGASFDATFSLDPHRPRYGRLVSSERPWVLAFLNAPGPAGLEDVRALAERLECVPKGRLRALAAEFAYDPNQPREPAGQPAGGRWVRPETSGEAAPAIKGAGGPSGYAGRLPRDYQEFRRLLSPRVRALQGYVTETVRCSGAFYAAVADALNSAPDDFHHVIHAAGNRVVIGDRLVNMDPAQFVGNQPRGHGPAGTWESLSGAFAPPPASRVYVAELVKARGAIVPSQTTLATTREELGHALDYALDQGAGRPSQADPDFLAAFKADVARLTDPAIRARMGYFLQRGGAGREELFAQLFIAMRPGALSPNQQAELLAVFPQCWKVMPKILP